MKVISYSFLYHDQNHKSRSTSSMSLSPFYHEAQTCLQALSFRSAYNTLHSDYAHISSD